MSEEDQRLFRLVISELFFDATFAWTPESLMDSWKAGGAWGAFQGAELVGFIVYRNIDSQVAEIMALASVPAIRKRGVMLNLLRALFEARKAVHWWLEVHEKNLPAVSLYQKLGFYQVGSRKNYYKDGGGALVMNYDHPLNPAFKS